MSSYSKGSDMEESFIDYEDSDGEIERDGLDPEADSTSEIEEEIEEIVDLSELKNKKDRHSLEVRRAIEEHLEKIRLRREIDYLFDDDFFNDEHSGK
ncbi:MAG: PA3496 family putative envelope integrity protein [Gammaproteobacteria bacterium]